MLYIVVIRSQFLFFIFFNIVLRIGNYKEQCERKYIKVIIPFR